MWPSRRATVATSIDVVAATDHHHAFADMAQAPVVERAQERRRSHAVGASAPRHLQAAGAFAPSHMNTASNSRSMLSIVDVTADPRCSGGADAPNCVTATAFLRAFNDGRLRHVGKRGGGGRGGDTSIDVATVARRLGHITQMHDKDRPEYVIQGRVAHDVAEISAKQGAEVILTSLFPLDQMQANKHEIEQALAEA